MCLTKFFQIFCQKGLHFICGRGIITKLSDTETSQRAGLRVWRSLVSRLNGVQEALSSNLSTRTTQKDTTKVVSFSFSQDLHKTVSFVKMKTADCIDDTVRCFIYLCSSAVSRPTM